MSSKFRAAACLLQAGPDAIRGAITNSRRLRFSKPLLMRVDEDSIYVLFLVAISPAIVCLGYAWRGRLKDLSELNSRGWRESILTITACTGTLSQSLTLGFLLQGFHADRQSFAEPASMPWAVANWVSLASWAFALVGTIIGRGKGEVSATPLEPNPSRHRLVRVHDGLQLLIVIFAGDIHENS